MRREKDKQEKEKSLSMPKDNASKLISRKLGRSNSKRKLLPLPSKPESRERTTCTKSRNKSKSNFKRERLKKIESKHSSTTPTRLEDRFQITRISRSKKDSTTWKRAERLERKSIWRETR